ncbi:UNVERIFIED_CONTAM: hypothetical protein FKN15_034504 [Acipenser sinensis]
MGDYGFGLLQTANIPNNSSTIFGGGAFARAHTTTTLACSTQFSSLSPSSFSISSSNAGVSPLFLSAPARQQTMQDELLLGVTTTQQHHSLPSERNNIHNKTGQPTNNDPDFSKQLDQQNRLEFNHLNQQQLSEFKPTANSEKFGQQINNHKQLNQQQQQADFGKKEQPPPPPPPQGEFNHLAQNQYQALNQQQGSPKLDQGNSEKSSESPIKSRSPVAEEKVVSEANAVAAASSSTSPVNPNKAKIQMESPNNHLINSNGSSAANNILPTGLLAGFNNLQNQEMQNQQQTQGGSSSPSLPGFCTPWSVQTSSPPPPVTNSTNPNHASPMNQITNAETDNSFYPGIPSSINPAFFQSFSPVSANSCAGINVPGFNSPFSPQINLPQQQQNRRSPPIMKQSPWSSHQGSGWNSGGMSWGGMHGRDHRRPGGMGIPGTMNQISPMKKPFSSNVIAPPKFPRSAASLTPKSWIEDRTDSNSNTLLPLQDRTRMYDSLNMHSLENSLIDIMRAEHDPLKVYIVAAHEAKDNSPDWFAQSAGITNANYNYSVQNSFWQQVEVKPYVLDDQMCDECQGARCGGKFAPFFCANVTCLQYYCEFCWANIHSRAGREFHKPLVKEGADRPRQIHFRWN